MAANRTVSGMKASFGKVQKLGLNLSIVGRRGQPQGVRECRTNFPAGKTKPQLLSQLGFRNLILTMTYSHMGKPHTTIGDAS
ncbi:MULTISPECIES: hypothetical protein, partial [unclassified Pseudomonas]|uniref:hypothetical protein n=1 Tax=unclassified Pseudomonas TaxID=196821 RepID=UPI001C456137